MCDVHLTGGETKEGSTTTCGGKENSPEPVGQEYLVNLKDIVCYLTLLEGIRPEDKLECKKNDLVFIRMI